MFFNSIKKENMSRKDINRLSKGTSNIYLKVAIEKNWHSKHRFSKTSCCNLKVRGLGTKLCMAFLLF